MIDERYKKFRNLMLDEIGITKEDFERWTKEATIEFLTNVVEDDGMKTIVLDFVKEKLTSPYYGKSLLERLTEKEISRILAKQFVVSLKPERD